MRRQQTGQHPGDQRQGQAAVPGGGDSPPLASRGVGFFAVCLAYCAIILDGSVLNVAIPTIRDRLDSSMAGAQWVLDAYTLPLAALLLTAGAVGDRIGLRRMLLAGIAVFTLASAACASAPDAAWLIGARAVQGAGAAALLPATLALVPHLFTRRADRERATVAWVAAGSIAVAAGPLVGGLLIDTFGWRSIFLINLPVGLLSGWLARKHVPETPRHRVPLDHAGQAARRHGARAAGRGPDPWRGSRLGSPATLGPLGGAVVAGLGFWLAERRGRQPMLPLSFFTQRARTTAVISAGLMGFVFYGTLFVMSLYFQQLRGDSPGLRAWHCCRLRRAASSGRSCSTVRCPAATAMPSSWPPASPAARSAPPRWRRPARARPTWSRWRACC
jgi:DHA2 family methylenomycin A resistance protein-like MFS transporter